MKTSFISLGSGCEIASRLNDSGLRKESLIFDWLWNFDLGLEAVTQIIEDDFEQFTKKENHIIQFHYKWNSNAVINKTYPTLAHIHTNPAEVSNDYETLIKRSLRFQERLLSDSFLHFFYYRAFDEYNPNIYKNGYTIDIAIEKLTQETESFTNMLTKKYPNIQFDLTAILLVSNFTYQSSKAKLERMIQSSYNHIYYRYAIDYSAHKWNVLNTLKSQSSWFKILLNLDHISKLKYYNLLLKNFTRLMIKSTLTNFKW